jgi:hypothetical protein
MAMTTAEQLWADLRSRGIELETDGVRLRWRPAFLVGDRLAEMIRSRRDELIALLREPGDRIGWHCPICNWPLDSARRCPKCFDRLCVDCGKPTGSYFILRCVICGHALEEQEQIQKPSTTIGLVDTVPAQSPAIDESCCLAMGGPPPWGGRMCNKPR